MLDALNTTLHPTLTGESDAVKQLFGKGEDEPFTSEDVEALEGMLTAINGTLTARQREAIRRAKVMFHRREENEKNYNDNPQKFVQGVQDRSDSLLITDPQKLAAMRTRVQTEFQEVRAAVAVDAMSLKQKLKAEQEMTITWPAKIRPLTTRGQGGTVQMHMVPEEVRIGSLRFCYAVGQVVKVPRSVAERLEQRKVSQQDGARRKDILGANGKTKEVGNASGLWEQANRDSGSSDPNPFSDTGNQVGINPLA
jgi:hypothetical protein